MKTIYRVLLSLLCAAPLYALAEPSVNLPPDASSNTNIAKSTIGMAQDTAITTYIYAKLASYPDLANSNLDISTNQGKVVLNGIVTNESQVKEIRRMAENTAGVKSVDASKLIVNQQDSALYVKTAASSAPQIETSSNPIPAAQTHTETQVSAADPLLTDKEANNPQTLAEAQPPAAAPAVTTQSVRPKLADSEPVSHHLVKAKPHTKAKHAFNAKKKKHHTLAAKSKKKILSHHSKKSAIHKKSLALHHHKAVHAKKLALHKPAKAPKAKVVASRQKSNESADQMTSSYLKSALLENKSIPEE